jgi:superfamily II DNA/RNA helicase
MIETRDKAIISKFTELAAEKKTIAFCVSIDHAEWSAEQFRLAGINAIALHSKVEAGNSESGVVTAKEILSAFENDEYQVVFVVDMLNEGIDIPDVECLLMMRPTQSSTILTQQIGRGLRIAPGKQEVLVLDFIGNYRTAPTILKGLGIGGIGKLTFDQDKDVYYYDNEGRTVEFEGSVVEIFKVVLSKSSREVDESLITEDWAFYSEYLKEMVSSGRHLYWSIAKKNNKIPMHLWAIDFALKNRTAHNDNKSLDSALQAAWREFSPNASSMEGIRALIFSKILGLIISTHPFEVSDAYKQRFAELSATNNSELTKAVTDQFEKYFFYSDFFSLVNRHSVEGERREIDRFFKLFPIFF